MVPLGDGDEKDAPEKLCVDVVNVLDRKLSYRRAPSEAVPEPVRRQEVTKYLPRCLDLISTDEVIRSIERYFAGGAVRYLTGTEAKVAGRQLNHGNGADG